MNKLLKCEICSCSSTLDLERAVVLMIAIYLVRILSQCFLHIFRAKIQSENECEFM